MPVDYLGSVPGWDPLAKAFEAVAEQVELYQEAQRQRKQEELALNKFLWDTFHSLPYAARQELESGPLAERLAQSDEFRRFLIYDETTGRYKIPHAAPDIVSSNYDPATGFTINVTEPTKDNPHGEVIVIKPPEGVPPKWIEESKSYVKDPSTGKWFVEATYADPASWDPSTGRYLRTMSKRVEEVPLRAVGTTTVSEDGEFKTAVIMQDPEGGTFLNVMDDAVPDEVLRAAIEEDLKSKEVADLIVQPDGTVSGVNNKGEVVITYPVGTKTHDLFTAEYLATLQHRFNIQLEDLRFAHEKELALLRQRGEAQGAFARASQEQIEKIGDAHEAANKALMGLIKEKGNVESVTQADVSSYFTLIRDYYQKAGLDPTQASAQAYIKFYEHNLGKVIDKGTPEYNVRQDLINRGLIPSGLHVTFPEPTEKDLQSAPGLARKTKALSLLNKFVEDISGSIALPTTLRGNELIREKNLLAERVHKELSKVMKQPWFKSAYSSIDPSSAAALGISAAYPGAALALSKAIGDPNAGFFEAAKSAFLAIPGMTEWEALVYTRDLFWSNGINDLPKSIIPTLENAYVIDEEGKRVKKRIYAERYKNWTPLYQARKTQYGGAKK